MEPLDALLRETVAAPDGAFMLLDDRVGNGRSVALATGAHVRLCVDPADGARALDALGDALDAMRAERLKQGVSRDPVGFVWLTYDAAWAASDPTAARDERPAGDGCPAAWLATYDQMCAVPLDDAAWPAFEDDEALGAFRSETDREAHRAGVGAVREAIRDGDVYLVNYARMLHAEGCGDGALAARVLRSGARYGALLRGGGVTVAGMSMELGLTWDRARGVASTRPIKGTRPRRVAPEEDRAEADALTADPKERAENAMAVDVHRNDLGRVAETGSVTVPRLFEAEAHRYVHHLVSTVEARVMGDRAGRDVLRAVLPVGSVTGAPKRSAMRHIARFERERRGLYTGVYGAVYGDGSVQLAVAIRTLVRDGAGLHYGVGGGIVWDSDPEREWEELTWKQRALQSR